MILLKIEVKESPDIAVSIGLKFQYKEFDYIEDVLKFLFCNANSIKNYTIYQADLYNSKCDNFSEKDRQGERVNSSVNINSQNSFGQFQ